MTQRNSSRPIAPCDCNGCDSRLEWISALVGVNRVRLLGMARRHGLSAEDSFDCVQESFNTFLRLPEARGLADRPDDAARLLTVIVRNAARTLRRRVARATGRNGDAEIDDIAGTNTGADESLAFAEARGSLQRCVLELNELQRNVVTLRMLEELPGEEVASALGISVQHVAVVLHRAKSTLRGCMTAAGHGAEGG